MRSLSGKQVCDILAEYGFVVVRQHGSHIIMQKQLDGMGTYEETLCVFGFGIGIASWTTGIHDLLTSFLGAIHVINQRAYEHALNTPTIWRSILWIQMMAYVIWFVILFAKGTKVVYKFTTAQAVMFGTVGFIIYQAFFFIFNR